MGAYLKQPIDEPMQRAFLNHFPHNSTLHVKQPAGGESCGSNSEVMHAHQAMGMSAGPAAHPQTIIWAIRFQAAVVSSRSRLAAKVKLPTEA